MFSRSNKNSFVDKYYPTSSPLKREKEFIACCLFFVLLLKSHTKNYSKELLWL